jgi:predicted nucleic acid-binding protein
MLVPDASVILKWVLPPEREPGSRAAMVLLDQFVAGEVMLAVPTLWYYEVANTIARLAPDVAGESLRQLRRLGMAEIGAEDAIERRALACVKQFGVTYYDAVYYATAVELGGVLVTADLRFIARLGGDDAIIDLQQIRLE